MKQKKVVISILALVLMMATPSIFVLSVRPVHAGGGIVLHPPFDGTYRVTAYFDHDEPSYGVGADGYNWIYNGERVPASYPNKTGEPYPYDGHDGWDWSMITGTNILAAAAGTVVVAEWGNWKGYGRTIIISHGNNYYTQYSHLDQLLVGVEAPVTAGQHIAESGATPPGTPAHLHFGVRHGGYLYTTYAIDPFGWRGSERDPLFDYNGKESSCLWAGVPGDDISCADIIVEDDGAGWTELHTWFDSTNGNGYREHHTYSWDPPPVSEAYWIPTLPAKGFYQVDAFVPPISSRTTHAHYVIDNGTTQYNVYRDQSGTAPRWMSLGTFEFPAGFYGWVNLDDYTTEPKYSHWVAADGMKFSASVVYLPNVRNSGGWTSSIVIRNNSTSSAQVGINYYDTGGGPVYYQTTTIAANGSQTKTAPYYLDGSAVVVASEDVSVVVVNDNNSEAYAYTGIPSGSSVSGVSVGTEVFVPCNLYNYYGWFTTLYVQNTGAAATTIHAYFYDDSGIEVDHDTATVNANGRASFSLTGAAIGSAKVTATQPLAVVVRQDLAGQVLAYPGISSAGTTAYFPALLKDYYGWYSAYQTQEVAGAPEVTVRYYPSGTKRFSLSTRGHENVWMGNEGVPNGLHSAKESLSTGGQVATAVHHANATGALGYQGFKAGARDVIMPSLKKYVNGWDASLTVQNVGTATAYVTAYFYYSDGSWAGSYGSFALQAGRSRLLYHELPGGFNGSVWIHSVGADVVAGVHQTHSNGRSMGYGAP